MFASVCAIQEGHAVQGTSKTAKRRFIGSEGNENAFNYTRFMQSTAHSSIQIKTINCDSSAPDIRIHFVVQ